MAKKPAGTKRRGAGPSRRRKSRHPIMKLVISLMALAALVVSAAVVARFLIPVHPAPEQAMLPTAPAQPAVEPEPQVTQPQSPTYEIYPPQPVTPPKPPPTHLPPGVQPPLVAIIVDDIGYDRRIAEQLLALDIPLTFSLLPYGPFNQEILSAARTRGIEVMLHLPMEPQEFPDVDPGPGALLNAMSPDELIARLNDNLNRIPGIVGVNNHMGSRLSTSPERMRQIFSILKKRDLFYVDSRTTPETVAKSSAQLLQLSFAERDIFIDHLDNPQFIEAQLHKLIRRAQKQGYALAIAHPHAATATKLKVFLPRLKAEVNVVPASLLVHSVMLAESENRKTAQKNKSEILRIE